MGKKTSALKLVIGLLCAGCISTLAINVVEAADKQAEPGKRPVAGSYATGDPSLPGRSAKDGKVIDYTVVPYEPAPVTMDLGMTGLVVYNNTNGLALVNPRNKTISDILLNAPFADVALDPEHPESTSWLGPLGSEGGGRFDMALTRDGETALITNFGDSAVYIVSLNSGTPVVQARIQIDFFAEDIVIDPSGQWALVSDGGFSPVVGVIHIPTRSLLSCQHDDDADPSTPAENDDEYPGEADEPGSWRFPLIVNPNDETELISSGYANSVDIARDGRTVLVADYFSGMIHVLLLDPSDGSLDYQQSVTL